MEKQDKSRDPKGRFAPGCSGNPDGGKKGRVGRPSTDIRARFAVHDPLAEAKILELLDANHPAVQMAAAREILDRAHGKPKQTIANEIDQGELEIMFRRWGLAARKVLVPAFGEARASALMADIKRKYDELKDGDSDGD